MFRVENADFIADKLASELLPDQEYREAAKNAQEAITRLIDARLATSGRIEFDVDWPLAAITGAWYLACADNGDGMGRAELQRYMTTLAVRGAGNSQSLSANQGMGLKISGPTRHREGLIIRSLKDGERTMVQIGWNGTEYGLIPVGPDGEFVVSVADDMFPAFINERGSGTVVTFLGSEPGANTFSPDGRPRGWLFKYLHQRFFRLSQDGIDVVVRVPSGDPSEWPTTPMEASEREAGRARPSFNRSSVKGTATIWDDAADRQGEGFRGAIRLPGDPGRDVPEARMHWWVLPTGPGTDVSSRTASGGSMAVLYQNELHDWRASSQANPFFARLGVLFAKNRIGFILEPLGSTITSDFARAHVLIGGTPCFETEAWEVWADQFRAAPPEPILRAMAEEQSRLQSEDPDRARRIEERLKDVMKLLRPRRFKTAPNGKVRASGSVSGPGHEDDDRSTETIRDGERRRRRKSVRTRGIGSVLAQIDPDGGEPANLVFSILKLDPKWVTEEEADSFTIVNGNAKGLRDRAAALAGENGLSAGILLLNKEFRGYLALLSAVSDWANAEGDEATTQMIESYTQEWVEQKMIEAVRGLRQLENGTSWLASHFDEALSPLALTAAFMADRYHTLREVKRAAGAIRRADVSA
jgi:hypothetical protein